MKFNNGLWTSYLDQRPLAQGRVFNALAATVAF
jgi:hypothetical protein